MNPISIDFETFFSKKLKYGLVQMIPEQYCAHELFDPYLISVCDGQQSWSGHPSDFNWDSIRGRPLISHNARFDQAVFNEMVRRGLAPADLTPPFWHCTANLSSFICNRRSLKDATEHLFGHRVSKDYRAVADGKNWPDEFSPAEREQIITAGREDAMWCWRIWDRYADQWPEMERRLSVMTINQGIRGVQIDRERLDQYLYQTHEMLQNTEKIIPWMSEAEDTDDWDDFKTKPTSTKCIAEQCRRMGIPCCPVKADDEDAYLEWETLYAPKHPWIYAVSAWRSVNKLYKTLETIKARLRADGTLPFSLKYFGAHTGRWSGDARVNLQNQRKRPIVCNEHGLMETNNQRIDAALEEAEETGKLPAWVRYVIDFRSLIIPRAGKKMIVSDLSQIEPRVLAWLAGDWRLLDAIRNGMSVYEAFARTALGYKEPLSKKSPDYKIIKIQVLGLGYGCGWRKFITIADTMGGMDITKDDPEWIEQHNPFNDDVKKVSGYGATSKKIVENFRERSPLTVALWRQLDEKLKRSVGEDFTMHLPSGRKMVYEDVRAVVRILPDQDTGEPKRMTEFQADTDGRFKHFYGGKLTENLVQAVSRDVFATQLVEMEDQGIDILFTVHDEAVVEVDQSVTAKDIEQHMSRCPEWLEGCPISAEAHEVSHYQK